jgi:hypothetical protein
MNKAMKKRKQLKICPLVLIFLLSASVLMFGCTPEPPSGLPDIYSQAQSIVLDNLMAPASAKFPDYDSSFVKYNTSILQDKGKGKLEYRVYDVNAYVDAQNVYGALIRDEFWVQVYVYVDDFETHQFGENGIHKGVSDHYYIVLKQLGETTTSQ